MRNRLLSKMYFDFREYSVHKYYILEVTPGMEREGKRWVIFQTKSLLESGRAVGFVNMTSCRDKVKSTSLPGRAGFLFLKFYFLFVEGRGDRENGQDLMGLLLANII